MEPRDALNISEQIARIDRTRAEIQMLIAGADKSRQDARYAPWQVLAAASAAGAALFAAGGTFVKLLA